DGVRRAGVEPPARRAVVRVAAPAGSGTAAGLPLGGTLAALADQGHLNLRPCAHLRQRFHVADGLGENVAWAHQPRFITAADRGAAEAERDRVATGPIGDLAGRDHGARILLRGDLDRDLEIDLLAPSQRR